jgi:hypothetical protein
MSVGPMLSAISQPIGTTRSACGTRADARARGGPALARSFGPNEAECARPRGLEGRYKSGREGLSAANGAAFGVCRDARLLFAHFNEIWVIHASSWPVGRSSYAARVDLGGVSRSAPRRRSGVAAFRDERGRFDFALMSCAERSMLAL